MKKLACLIALCGMTSFVYADDTYISFSVASGSHKFKLKNNFITNKTSTSVTPMAAELAFGTYLSENFRIDLGLNYLSDKTSSIGRTTNPLLTDKVKLSLAHLSGLVNLHFDFQVSDTFIPSVTAGVGYGRGKMKMKGNGTTSVFQPSAANNKAKLTTNESGLTWQIGADLDYRFNDNYTVIIGYRMRNYSLDKLAFKYIDTTKPNLKIDAKVAHLMQVGIRYEF